MDSILKKPGIDSLIKVNSLANIFNNSLDIKDHNSAYGIIFKMRIIHGKLLCEFNSLLNNNDNDSTNKCVNLSCMSSILNLINEKIVSCEILFNKYLNDNNINPEDLKIPAESKKEKQPEEEILRQKQTDDLPLFDGIKSPEIKQREDIRKEISDLNNKKDKPYADFNIDIPSLLFFYNPGCPACIKTKPAWDSLTNNIKKEFNKETPLFNIIEINLADQSNENLAILFQVQYIPTIIMMESSKKPLAKIEKIEGMSTKERIQSFIKDSYNKFK